MGGDVSGCRRGVQRAQGGPPPPRGLMDCLREVAHSTGLRGEIDCLRGLDWFVRAAFRWGDLEPTSSIASGRGGVRQVVRRGIACAGAGLVMGWGLGDLTGLRTGQAEGGGQFRSLRLRLHSGPSTGLRAERNPPMPQGTRMNGAPDEWGRVKSHSSLGLDSVRVKGLAASGSFSSENLLHNALSGSSGGPIATSGRIKLFIDIPATFREDQQYTILDGHTSLVRMTCRQDDYYSRSTKPLSVLNGTHVVLRGPQELSSGDKRSIKENSARYLIGFLLYTAESQGAEFNIASAGQLQEANKAFDVLDLRSADGISTHLYLDSLTHRPTFLSWSESGKQVTLTLSRYSSFGGIELPTHLEFAKGHAVFEKWDISSYSINPSVIRNECAP